MTISTSYNFNPTAETIVRMAFQATGALGLGRRPRPDQINDARDILTVVLEAMQAKGPLMVQKERVTLALTAGTATYTLDADTMDVEFPTTYSPPGVTTETIVERMAYSDYQILSDKTAQGTPVRVYVEKSSILTATFWNVPNAAGTWHYRRARIIRDASAGSTLDVTSKFIQAIVWKLAHKLSLPLGVPLARVQYLETQAIAAEAEVTGDDNERGDLFMSLPNVLSGR